MNTIYNSKVSLGEIITLFSDHNLFVLGVVVLDVLSVLLLALLLLFSDILVLIHELEELLEVHE